MSTDLDEAKTAVSYVLVEITVDNMLGENPTQEEMDAYAVDFANNSNIRVMSGKSLLSYRATHLKGFVWYNSKEEIPKAE